MIELNVKDDLVKLLKGKRALVLWWEKAEELFGEVDLNTISPCLLLVDVGKGRDIQIWKGGKVGTAGE